MPEKDAKYFKGMPGVTKKNLNILGIKYEASSPDEATLVDAAKNLGYILEVCGFFTKLLTMYRNVLPNS